MTDNLQDSGLLDLLGLLDINISVLIAAVLFGIIGMWLFAHGRKHDNRRNKIVGILLMFYPYVVPGAWLNWIVGCLLCAYAYYWWD